MSDTKKAPVKKATSSKVTKAQLEAKVQALQVEVSAKDDTIEAQKQEIQRLQAALAKAPRGKNKFPCDAIKGCPGHLHESVVQKHRDAVAKKAKEASKEGNQAIEDAEKEATNKAA